MYSLHVLLAKSIVAPAPALKGFSNLHSTLEIGYSDSVGTRAYCYYNRLFLYQIILMGALSNQVHDQN